jgi:hypothetical protein
MMIENLQGYIATGIVSFVVGYFLIFLQPKAKLFFWAPHTFYFQLIDENVGILTQAITLQNLGRQSAKNIQIIFDKKPDFYAFEPKRDYIEKEEKGQFLIMFDSLGPQEFVTLQMLSHKTMAPNLSNIRCESGIAKELKFQITKVFPAPIQYLTLLLIALGFGFLFYWVAMGVIFISENIL